MRNYIQVVQPHTIDSESGRTGLRVLEQVFFNDASPVETEAAIVKCRAAEMAGLLEREKYGKFPRICVWDASKPALQGFAQIRS